MTAPAATLVSFRLGGPDGVSVESAKWVWALEQLGFAVTTVAGAGNAGRVLPGLAIGAPTPPDPADLAAAFDHADVVVVENLCSLPLNRAALKAVAGALKGRPAVLHHHDLSWQREATRDEPPPPDDPAWIHVTINDLSRRQLAERGIDATTVRNAFDPDPPAGDRDGTRRRLGVEEGRTLLVHPTRALPRKGVATALALAAALGADYWLLGPADDGYGPELERLLAGASRHTTVHRGLDHATLADAYAAGDAVVFPSSWEGFGNPVLESATHRRPLALSRYPVAAELEAFGFRWFPADEAWPLHRYLADPDPALLDHNHAIARASFNLADLPQRLGDLFRAAGWRRW